MNLVAMILQTSNDQAVPREIMMFFLPLAMIVGVIVLVIILIPFWFICKKAGFSGWLTLLNIIPMGNLVLLYVLAFAEWKVVPVAQLTPYPVPVPPPYPPVPPTA
jgi:hypothetical protein